MPLYPSSSSYPNPSLYPQLVEPANLGSFATSAAYTTSPLNEEFRQPQGRWENYDAYEASLRAAIRGQQHIDIRDFNSADNAAPLSVLDLSKFSMNTLITEVEDLDDSVHVLVPGEHWTVGTNTSLSTHNYWRVLQVTLASGTTTTASVTAPIDLLTDFEDDDFISLAMPDFPLSFITPSSSFVDLTSNPTGAFTDATKNASVALSASTVALTDGNSQFKVLRSAFDQNDIDLGAVTGVRLRIASTGPVTNLIPNPSFENGLTTPWSTDDSGTFDEITVVDGTPNRKYGTNVAKVHHISGGTYSGIALGRINVTAGLPYSFSAWVQPDVVGRTIAIYIQWWTAPTGGSVISAPSASVASSFVWNNLKLENQVAPVGAQAAALYLRVFGVADNGNTYYDGATFEQSTVAHPYFDGSMPGFAWTGTPNASTSVGPVAKFASLRLLSKDWKFGAIDLNTRRGTLTRTVSPNANPTMTTDFTQPIVWRSAEVPGSADPKPIDFNIAVGFNTGSRQGSNNISIYGRELTEDFMQQLDLNGLNQARLDGREQPDIGAAAYNPRLQTDLEPFKQDQLTGLDQYDLERSPDYLSASWIQFAVQWTATNTQVSVTNTEGSGYNFNLGTPLSANSNYVLVFWLEDTAARAAIYPLGARGQIIFNAPVFDSTLIDDDFVYKRRKGRFGWFANLSDGDAYIESIRFRSANYAEYRSLPYESITPVVGAELSAEASPIIDLFLGFEGTDDSIIVDRDHEVTLSGDSWRVTDYGNFTYQGIQSNEFDVTDFDQTEILLDVFYPSSLDQEATLEFYLKNDADYLIALPKPKIYPDQWQTIRLRVPSTHLAQTGLYRFIIVQNRPVNLNWWVDNVRIFERTVSWYGRGVVEDPWAATEDDWTPFQNAFNRDFGGILFQGRERRVQIKGVGHKQDAVVKKVQFKPRYAELGRFVWPEEALVGRVAPVASYSTTNSGRVYTFNGFGSSDPDGQVINWYWTVSDGSVYVGPIIQHTFGQSGSYTVTLTVTDQNGLVHSSSAIHSVA